MAEALRGASIVIGAMPSAHARKVYSAAADAMAADAVIVSATKGLEPATHARMSEVIAAAMPGARIAVLSGPSFALEVAKGSPTAVVIAAADAALATDLQEQFAAPNFRLYTNDDVLGVELAGAMKNVIAIAAGTCQGLGLGANTLAALITRGLAEMSRLAAALGARPETLSGLAGLGDLVLTCNGALSRNRHVGMELAKGRPLNEILAGMAGVAEGVDTAKPSSPWRASTKSSFQSRRKSKRSCAATRIRAPRFARSWSGRRRRSKPRKSAQFRASQIEPAPSAADC